MSPSSLETKRESEPLLPAPVTSTSTPRNKLSARRYTPILGSSTISDKNKGKGRAVVDNENEGEEEDDDEVITTSTNNQSKHKRGQIKEDRGRFVTIIFSNESESTGGNLDVWVDQGENVGSVKDKIRHLRPSLSSLNLRLIHSGRLLTDGILFLPWLKSLEERVRRQAQGVGGDVESVLKEVGLTDSISHSSDQDLNEGDKVGNRKSNELRYKDRKEKEMAKEKEKEKEKVWLHCIVGAKEERENSSTTQTQEEPAAPRRRGFDVLLDAGLSPADVAAMRRQFYESRGEEAPETNLEDVNDEHARALEEQWIEGDMTADTATTSTEGLYSSILHGLLTGFLLPLTPWFFFRELPLPNFFDSDEEARRLFSSSSSPNSDPSGGGNAGTGGNGRRESLGLGSQTPAARAHDTTQRIMTMASVGVGPNSIAVRAGLGVGVGVSGEAVSSVVFGQRMQMGIVLGTLINIGFGALRFLN